MEGWLDGRLEYWLDDVWLVGRSVGWVKCWLDGRLVGWKVRILVG